MDDKILPVTALAVVMIIGIVGIVNFDQANTGAAMLENRYCTCYVFPEDPALYRTGQGGFVPPTKEQILANPQAYSQFKAGDIRVRSAAQHTDQQCDNRGDIMYKGYRSKYVVCFPTGLGTGIEPELKHQRPMV